MQTTILLSSQIKSLAQSYNPLASRKQLLQALESLSFNSYSNLLTKHEVIQIYNELLLNHYEGESSIKYFLFREFANKNVTAAFEIRVNSSRADFLVINGDTKSFEIKSGLDNLKKLGKQSSDYSKAFEYNFAVIDEKHLDSVLRMLPTHFGIWSYSQGKKRVCQKASLSKEIDAEFQLGLLTKKELRTRFKECEGVAHDILRTLTSEEINSRFKEVLKSRYNARWSFVRTNSEKILPIDIQFFFSTNLDPKLVYQISS